MREKHVIIVGGGVAGLSAGCYALASGFRVTIVEHNLALGGVCTAWHRGPYLIDGCIQWLTGGVFDELYRQLGLLDRLELRPIREFLTYRDVSAGAEVTISSDLAATAAQLQLLAPEDGDEILRMADGAERLARLDPGVAVPPELTTARDRLERLWSARRDLGTLAHFRKPMKVWTEEHLRNARLQRLLSRLLPAEAPAFFLLMLLGYLHEGWLSRPVGGTAAFRDALVAEFERRGGRSIVHATVDEILVDGGRATGVRLGDGTMLDADVVISTASVPETVLRLLAGRYGAEETRDRVDRWALFQPIVLASFGVQLPLKTAPGSLMLDRVEPFLAGNLLNEHLHVRVYNDDPCFAPEGHSVVQVTATTDYDFWAKSGTRYGAEKDILSSILLSRIEPQLPGVSAAVRVRDMATPLTFWNMARAYRGAFEGWIPDPSDGLTRVKKTLPGLAGFYMAGQWVEPGGGIPMAVMSGHHAVQLICADEDRPFHAASTAA